MLTTSRFLNGPFAPVTDEITAFDLPVTGSVPAELSGRYLRNGPNPMGLDDPGYHWFIGDGMVHGVLFHRAGNRAGHPGGRQRQLRRAVHGRRALRHPRGLRHPAREACPMST